MGWDGGRLRVFLTTGRLDLARFRAAPQHHYLVRTIDPPDASDLPPRATVVLARPPFTVADEVALMRSHGIDLLVTKNSGGAASAAKLAAARELWAARPDDRSAARRPARFELHDLAAVLAWIADSAAAGRRSAASAPTGEPVGRGTVRVSLEPTRTSVLMSASFGSASASVVKVDALVRPADRAGKGHRRFRPAWRHAGFRRPARAGPAARARPGCRGLSRNRPRPPPAGVSR